MDEVRSLSWARHVGCSPRYCATRARGKSVPVPANGARSRTTERERKPDQTPHDHSMPEDRKHSGEQEQTVHEGMTMGGMNMAKMNPAGMLLMDEASGTSVNPASSPMHMASAQSGTWTFMFHGILYLSDIQQSGPRGAGKFVSTNWFMGMAQHDVGRGSFLFRAMLSLDPATVTQRRYPELLQTGETAFGKPLVDGQHPHDLFMELAFQC